jgi:galactokinase
MLKVENIKVEFVKRFEAEPRLFRAPGRVNLIGEHTDYNDGFVMPFAIDRATIVAGTKRDDQLIKIVALDMDESASIDLDAEPQKQRDSWTDYVEGMARCVEEKFGRISGANLLITSDVPIGSGLSSSAAIEVSVGLALLSLSDIEIDREKLACAGQKAEHEYAGTKSGIMDQFASALCKKGSAMLLDCRSLERQEIPFETDDSVTVVCDTKVEHSLASTEYNKRREECEEGVRLLQKHLPEIKALRDVSLDDLEKYKSDLSDTVFRRCRHVISENDRTLKAAEYFKSKDLAAAGKLMFESHASLRDDYQVSCKELDALVDIAASIDGVFGARMTGGGFGGCTVNIIRKEVLDEFKRAISEGYSQRFDREPDIYEFHAADGASEVTP